MKNLKITPDVLDKINKTHGVKREEVEHCFANRIGRLLIDNRPQHKTNPDTLWFLALTNQSRLLKVAYIQRESEVQLKSAFDPNEIEIEIYKRHG